MLTLGDYLKTNRLHRKINLRTASDFTKIPINLIKALEAGNYKVFSSEVYIKGFIKNYVKYLNIDTQKALAIYRRERRIHKENTLLDSQKPLKEPKPIITPGRLILFLTIIIVFTVIAFIILQVNKLIQPPYLELTEPINTKATSDVFTEVNTETINIVGKVEVGSKLLINGSNVTTNNLQEFRVDKFNLHEGSNEIFIVAESYYFSKKNQIKLTVLYNKNNEPTNDNVQDTIDTIINMQIEIDIGPDEAWLVATVDEETKVSNVVKPDEHFSFTANETFTIYSPRPQTVHLKINNQEYTFTSQAASIFRILNGKVVQE